ncbi:MAG TPA: EAL domain-containing protein [Chthonomonadales bacterium]|nr:EAL domain-containing protein [Chthonomonadales bacterium]
MDDRDRFAEHAGVCGSADLALDPRPSALTISMAPLDEDAGRALCTALLREGLEYRAAGPFVHVATDAREAPALASRLANRLPRGLQSRVKAVLTNGPSGAAAALEAEALPSFLDAVDVAWLVEALRSDWLFSVFQPIMCASDGSAHAFEAFVRAHNPVQNSAVGAGQLIYASQRLNLEREFDLQARAAAIRDGARLGLFSHRVFVNFHPEAIYDPEVCLRRTVATAAENGVTMDRLVFEVVESEQLVRSDHLRTVLDFVRAHGAMVALDDIGDGYSSLELVADLAPDYVKIDGALIASSVTSPSSRRTLDAVVALAAQLGMRVIATGVEQLDQMGVAIDCGVDYLQGCLFALPGNPPAVVDPRSYPAWRRAA